MLNFNLHDGSKLSFRIKYFWFPEDGDSCYKTGWIDR